MRWLHPSAHPLLACLLVPHLLAQHLAVLCRLPRLPSPLSPASRPSLAPVPVVHMVVACRRERVIDRAARQRMQRRTLSRKAAEDAASAAAEESKWRQAYSQRMAVRAAVCCGRPVLVRGQAVAQECGSGGPISLIVRACAGRRRVLPSADARPLRAPARSTAPCAQDSMRRAEEALGRQSAQANGPSFVEAHEREFAQQAGAGMAPQLSSKKSCE